MEFFELMDYTLLGIFLLFVIIFLTSKKNKKNLQRQGIIYLYKTQIGVRLIDKFTKKYEKILRPTRYVVLTSGYILLVAMLWLIIKTTWLYFTTSISQVIRAPPIAPLIPYFPKLFGLEAFFPPLYFVYFIIAIAIVATTHEFSHGIFARLEKLKIQSTGFAFLGPILGAFVEPDEKQMNKAPKFAQLSILAAGTFANVLMTILFGLIMAIFFIAFFSPFGLKFNTYVYSSVNVSDINIVGDSLFNQKFVEITVEGKTFFADKEALRTAQEKGVERLIVFDDAPAFRNQIEGAIIELNGNKIESREALTNSLAGLNPGDNINLKTAVSPPGRDTVSEIKEYNFNLGERNGKAYLGVAFLSSERGGITGKVYSNTLAKIKKPLILYKSSLEGFGWFIYYLLWWIIMINLLVALFNMLPLGMLDGGRFFYLTVWGVTGSEKIGKKAYSIATYFLLALVLAMMIKWVFVFT